MILLENCLLSEVRFENHFENESFIQLVERSDCSRSNDLSVCLVDEFNSPERIAK